MIMRAMALAGGIAGAAGLSQFPEFSQQYVQRLGGAVDELSRFISEFDADAARFDLSREAALADLEQGGRMAAARAESMRATLARHARLSGDLEVLRQAGPFTRAYEAGRLSDRELAEATWADFKPALPLTFEGGMFGVSAVPVPLIWCIPVGFDWSDICLQHFCWRWLWRMELGLWVVWRLLNLVWATVVGPMR
ncbi:DUF2937 family protein [Roseovarius sp. C7]|uniref:DUF2937 family protein n=1 Tax=Roseovarius sp. C7 TaxID=3398643 RepID=UPI0039F6FDA5